MFRYSQIAERLQRDIESGRYPLGEKLPSERDLAKRLEAGNLTVRQGISLLVKKGLVRREHGSGTYVIASRALPLIGVMFGPSLVAESGHFYRALFAALQIKIMDSGYLCRSYDGFNHAEYQEPEQALPFQLLERTTRSNPLAGVIQVSVSDRRWNEKSQLRGVPAVSCGERERDVIIDFTNFGRDALTHLAGEGRRRIVYLRCFLNPQNDLGGIGDAAKKLGVPMPLVVSIDDSGRGTEVNAYRAVRELLASTPDEDRPDGLIISDDIAARGAALALIKAGIDVPKDISVVALGNEGINHHYGIPIKRHMLSPTEIAEALFSVLRERMAGREPASPRQIVGAWEAPGAPDEDEIQWRAYSER